MTPALRTTLQGGIVWDNHACMPLDPACPEMNALEQCRRAGVDVISLNVASGDQRPEDALQMLTAFRAWLAARPDEYLLVATADDARAAQASGRLGVCFDIEGMSVLEGDLDRVGEYHALGVRWMLSAYNRANAVGGGCLDDEDQGLTPFGRAVVAEMNRVGIVVCASHAGYRTARELIDLSGEPVIFSHSNPRAVWDTPRNVPDELLLACARRGGVIGINGIGAFMGANDARIDTYVRHLRYALDLIGDDHVGIALDYCFGPMGDLSDLFESFPALFPPQHGYQRAGLKMVAPWQLHQVASRLQAKGLSTETLRKLFGGNHLRIADTVWRHG